MQTGKADGLKSISLEVLDTFGIGDAIRNESHRVEEIVLWEPENRGGLARYMTIPDRVPELGKPREMTLDQGKNSYDHLKDLLLIVGKGRIEYHMATALLQNSNVEISWKKQPISLDIKLEAAEDLEAYPVTVAVRDIDGDETASEIIQARYVIACDGAHSWTRKHLDIPLVGDLTDSSWGKSLI